MQHNIVHEVQHNIVHKVHHNIVHKVQHNIVHEVKHNIIVHVVFSDKITTTADNYSHNIFFLLSSKWRWMC